MSYNFEGKVAIVTGAGGGLGFEYAKYLALHGAKVVVNDLGGDPLGMDNAINKAYAAVAAEKIIEAGGEAVPNQDSVSDYKSAKRIVDQAIDTWGRIDIIINNAGITSPAIFPDIEKEEMEQQHAVHVMGAINTMRAAWPHMIEQKYGRIINTSSSSALGFVSQIAYPSMKSALLGLNNSLALVGKEHNIHVNGIMPAAFTRMSGMLPDGVFRKRLEEDYRPEKLAPVVAYLCHDECPATGEIFSIGGGHFYRIVFAASETFDVDMTMDSVASQFDRVMEDKRDWSVVHDAFDDLKSLGFSEDEFEMFKDMSATHGADKQHEVDAVKIKNVDNVWKICVKSPVGDQFSNLVMKSEGGSLVGNIINDEHGIQGMMNGKIQGGDTMLWTTKITKPVPLTLKYEMQMDENQKLGGTLKGTLMGKEVMNAPVIGEVLEGPEAEEARKQSDAAPAPKPGFFARLFG